MNQKTKEWVLNNTINDKIDHKLRNALRDQDINVRLTAIPLRGGTTALTAKIEAINSWLAPYVMVIELGAFTTYAEMNRKLTDKIVRLFRCADKDEIGAKLMRETIREYADDFDATVYADTVSFANDLETRLHKAAEAITASAEKNTTAQAA